MVILVFFLVSCADEDVVVYETNEEIAQEVELINGDNQNRIGVEGYNPYVEITSDNEISEPPSTDENDVQKALPPIPANAFFHSVVDETCYFGDQIQEIATSEGVVPAVIIPNGSMAVFSRDNSDGWACDAGDTLSLEFEKYAMLNNTAQTLGVGHIKDGVLCEMELFKDELEGKYEVKVTEKGVYYICVICLSSDPISLKEGEIKKY